MLAGVGGRAAVTGVDGMEPTGRVLVVDDDRDILRLIGEALADEGWGVVTARNGIDALALANTSQLDLILLDMQMPIMDGWEFLRAYREAPGPHVPVVVLTAGSMAGRIAEEAGAEGHLAKPFSLDSLIAAVGRHVRPQSSAA